MESKKERAEKMANSVKWLTRKEKEMYAGAIHAALCWSDYIDKQNLKLKNEFQFLCHAD